jgi:sugar diacid utilization regulator
MKQVDRCLEFSLGAEDPTGVVTFDGCRSAIALGCAAQAIREDPMLRFPELEILRKSDSDEGTNYVDTLGASLMSLGNMRAAAEKMGVHITTLHYRLGRIHQSAGTDTQGSDTRLLYGLLLRDGGGEFR